MTLGESVNLLIPLLNVTTLNKPFSAFFITLLSNWPVEGVSEPRSLGLQSPALILTTTVPRGLKP